MYFEVSVQKNMQGNQEEVWSLVTDLERFPSFFNGFVVIPSVERIEVLYKEPFLGGQRRVHNSDGSVIEEEIISFTPHSEQQYRLCGGFSVPFSWMIYGAEATWLCTVISETETNVSWKYRFHVRSLLLAPLTFIVVKLFFVRAMWLCVQSMAKACTEQFTT